MAEHFDIIIIGTGAGGGTLAHTLAPSGKRILLLERGDFLPREMDNWSPKAVFEEGKYISEDTWYDADGKAFQPQVHYFVGGATKMYGAALYRLRPGDFQELKHVDGISLSWPLGYDDFEPWYTRAEWLYQVHGAHGEDPIEGHWSRQYPWPAVSNEPRIQQLFDDLVAGGYHPFHAPCGILLDEERPRFLGPRPELQGARAGQPVRRGHQLLSEHRSGQSRAHGDGQRDPGRRAHPRAHEVADRSTGDRETKGSRS
jgi:choline dehydrogenase-like flavoprotein